MFPHSSHSLHVREDDNIVLPDVSVLFESIIFLNLVLTHHKANFYFIFQ